MLFFFTVKLHITWQHMHVLVSIHVVRQVACQVFEKCDLGSQLQLYLRRQNSQRISQYNIFPCPIGVQCHANPLMAFNYGARYA